MSADRSLRGGVSVNTGLMIGAILVSFLFIYVTYSDISLSENLMVSQFDGVIEPVANLSSSFLNKDTSADPEWKLTASCSDSTIVPPTYNCKPLVRGKGRILVTGGAGFIGSHTVLQLLREGYSVTVMDNLINSSPESIARVARLAGSGAAVRLQLVLMDLRDATGLRRLFQYCGPFESVIHFAGLKAVGESVGNPLAYYDNNVAGTVTLLKAMKESQVTQIIFSSSATVYGTAKPPFREDAPTGVGITNPYGQTKFVIERILRDCVGEKKTSGKSWHIISLRYFNPIGADTSGEIGELPSGIPNNVMPYITQVAVKIRPHLTIFGTDYQTSDGTGERDYIHVLDLANGHVAALKYLSSLDDEPSSQEFNLGTGNATSVLQLVKEFTDACDCEVPIKNGARRPGDLAKLYSDPSKANEVLKWRAKRSIAEACVDTWKFMTKNPNGFTKCVVER